MTRGEAYTSEQFADAVFDRLKSKMREMIKNDVVDAIIMAMKRAPFSFRAKEVRDE